MDKWTRGEIARRLGDLHYEIRHKKNILKKKDICINQIQGTGLKENNNKTYRERIQKIHLIKQQKTSAKLDTIADQRPTECSIGADFTTGKRQKTDSVTNS